MNASWHSRSPPVYSSQGLRTRGELAWDISWTCTNLPSHGEVDSLMSGMLLSYSALLLLSSHFVACTSPVPLPLTMKQRIYEYYLVFPNPLSCAISSIPWEASLQFFTLMQTSEGWKDCSILFLSCWHSYSPGKTNSDQCSSQGCVLTDVLAPAFKETPSSLKTTKKEASKDMSTPPQHNIPCSLQTIVTEKSALTRLKEDIEVNSAGFPRKNRLLQYGRGIFFLNGRYV